MHVYIIRACYVLILSSIAVTYVFIVSINMSSDIIRAVIIDVPAST